MLKCVLLQGNGLNCLVWVQLWCLQKVISFLCCMIIVMCMWFMFQCVCVSCLVCVIICLLMLLVWCVGLIVNMLKYVVLFCFFRWQYVISVLLCLVSSIRLLGCLIVLFMFCVLVCWLLSRFDLVVQLCRLDLLWQVDLISVIMVGMLVVVVVWKVSLCVCIC